MPFSPSRSGGSVSLRTTALTTAGAVFLAGVTPLSAGEIADALDVLVDHKTVQRSVSLNDLGISVPLSLTASSARQDIYIPVPAGVDLLTPMLEFEGHYLRADGGETTYTLSLDSHVVAAGTLQDDEGRMDVRIGVDGLARNNGFVNLGVNWLSSGGSYYCGEVQPIGNILQVLPGTRLTYSYLAADVKDIATAWSALPLNVTLLVAGRTLDEASYEAAWRLGMALEKAGKNIEIHALPETGDTVDASGIKVPAALRQVPAFAAFAAGGEVRLRNDAELGAYLVLRAPAFRPDIVVAGNGLNARLTAALSGLSAQLKNADFTAVATLNALRDDTEVLPASMPARTVGLRSLFGRPVIAVAPGGATEAAGLFDTLWRNMAVAKTMTVRRVTIPDATGNSLVLGDLSQASGNLDVVSRSEWSTTFSTGEIAPGKVPSALDIRVSAAPGATATHPVASVFLNGYLLGARQLSANGQPETIPVNVPSYALLPLNMISVRFQRQPASDKCGEIPQAFPVSVLPDSRIMLKEAPPAHDFVSVVTRLSGDSYVGVPDSWLSNALQTLPTLVRVARASGISPSNADFDVVHVATVTLPQKPFLLFDLAVEGLPGRIEINGDAVTVAGSDQKPLFDVSGLSDIAVVEAVYGRDQNGITYQSVGSGPAITRSFQLGHGNLAVLGDDGVLTSVNADGEPIFSGEDGAGALIVDKAFTPKALVTARFWAERVPQLLTVAIIGSFALLWVFAGMARRRERSRAGKDHG